MAKAKKPSPFDVDLDATERNQLADWLCTEIDGALSARSAVIADGGLIDLSDWFYEQGRSRPEDRPFPGAADLTSYFITENVDALRARLMKAVFGVRPFCFVEGWGPDAKKAPFVEEFHDWQVRKGTLKSELAKTVHGALIEDCYILEVSEKIETRRITETIEAALEMTPDGAPVFEGGMPKLKMDAQGEPVLAGEGEPHAKVERTYTKAKRLGPQYDPISMKDFVFLPGHAKSQKTVWGYAYRFWKRLPELREMVKDGIYDEAAVKLLGDGSDRDGAQVPTTVAEVAPQYEGSVEKELWQVALKRDLDGDGREEWYVATLSLRHRALLRLKLDTFAMKVGRSRCVPFVLFPRRESVYGYSYSFSKLMTLSEEHTSLRNMKADRSALATSAPIQQLAGGMWDADAEPFGVGAKITVRTHDELKQMQIADVPNSVVEQERALHQAKERVGGLADSAVGVLSGERRTLGENEMVSRGSAVRVDEVVGHLHLAIADVMLLSNAIWVETLEADPKGIEAPPSVMDALSSRQMELPDGRFTAQQLKGNFQFEPYGSDETADNQKRKADFNSGLQALGGLAQVFPGLQVIMQNPEATKAILEQWLRVFDVRDRQPFLGALQQAATAMPQAAGPGGPAPMGAPPQPGMGAPAPGGMPDIAAIIAAMNGGQQ
jgi:hypothetical protein